jgi:type VI secretion system protein ImpG
VTDDLLLYYERELTYLRQMGAQFSTRYPKVAARLQLEPTKCEDPHVERLLEGFAFLAARLHHKMDDDVPEISEALLGVLYPHFVRPVPSITLVEFETDAAQLTKPVRVPRGSSPSGPSRSALPSGPPRTGSSSGV